MSLEITEYRELYVKTIEVNLVQYLYSLKTFANKYECEEEIKVIFDNIEENDMSSLLAQFILQEIEEYGEIFNTAVLDFDDIKILIFIAKYMQRWTPEDKCKKFLLLNALYMVNDIIRQEKMYQEYPDEYPIKINAFIMINKVIDRIKSKRSGFTPDSISYDDLEKYYGRYGIYMLAKSSYYPFQSYIEDEYESYKVLSIFIDLLKDNIVLDSDIVVANLEVLENATSNPARVESIAELLYQYGDDELRKKLTDRKLNE